MNELKTLIDVSAGTRSPQYEPVIFSDDELTEYYLNRLCEQYGWYKYRISIPDIVYHYASYVMKCRWPEAEAIIAAHPYWAYRYSKDLMGARWPEAEAIISTDAAYRMWYNRYFGTNI